MMDAQGRSFGFVVGSDVQRDGMYYEATEIVGGKSTFVAEVFYSDQSHSMTFTAVVPDIPIEIIDHMLEQARIRLVPIGHPAKVAE
ncbi:hypothetical protein [Aminobacter sp. Piv2-1]|uniref:hypothetical protein n=1 Tax=Aminobacter sp. Piv2-1 TaxID=3031122 RepID=UPI0030B1949D